MMMSYLGYLSDIVEQLHTTGEVSLAIAFLQRARTVCFQNDPARRKLR